MKFWIQVGHVRNYSLTTARLKSQPLYGAIRINLTNNNPYVHASLVSTQPSKSRIIGFGLSAK